jgi:hypothetical protein
VADLKGQWADWAHSLYPITIFKMALIKLQIWHPKWRKYLIFTYAFPSFSETLYPPLMYRTVIFIFWISGQTILILSPNLN